MTVRLLQLQGTRLTHTSLRRPFYGQCFAAAPFALLLGVGTLLHGLTHPGLKAAGVAAMIVAAAWYFGVQSCWFSRRLGISLIAGFGNALLAGSISAVLFVVAAIIVS